MSARTRMTTRAPPGRTAAMHIPSAWLARSRSKSAAAARSARCWASVSLMLTPASAAREARRALLAEGRDPFRVVGAAAELALIVALDVELLAQRAIGAWVDGLLGAREPAGRRRRQLQRQALHHRLELRVLDA